MTLEELGKLVESKKSIVVISKGISPLSLLGVAFIVMKIMGYITWSWWWVLAPFWIPLGIALLILGCLLLFVFFSIRKLDKECKKLVEHTQEETTKVIVPETKEDTKIKVKEEIKKPVKKSNKKSKKVTDGNDSNETTTKSKRKNV